MSKLLEQINIAERKTYHIKDMGRVVTGKTPSKNNPEDWGDEVDFITPTDFSGTEKYLSNIKRKISKEGVSRYKNMILPSEAVVVTCIGSDMGKVIVSKNKSLTNQQINSIIVNKELFDTEFVYYTLKSLYTTLRSIAEEGGSTMPIITKSIFEQIEFEAPDLPTQKKIVSILSVYDEKIENNNKIIKNLEETAQTIFNEWFVNFKFPGYEKVKMVKSEMGEIPEGWKIGNIETLCKRLPSGKVFKEGEISMNGNIPVYDQSSKGIIGFHNEEPAFNASLEKPILIFGDHTCRSQIVCEPFSLGPNTIPLGEKDNYNPIYSFFLIKGLIEQREYKRHWNELISNNFIIPGVNLVNQFIKLVYPVMAKIIFYEKENISLKSQRDLLLAKLI